MKSVSHIILAALFASGTALAQDAVDFDEHDQDGDGYLSQEEWDQVENVAIDFETADIDRDGRLDRSEVEQAERQSAMLVGAEETDPLADEERVAHEDGTDIDYQDTDEAVSQQASVEDDAEQTAGQDVMAESGQESASFEQTAEQDEFMQAGAEDEAAMESTAAEEPLQESDIGYVSTEVEEDESRSEAASDVEFVSDEEPAEDAMQAGQPVSGQEFPEDEGKRAFADADADGDGMISEDEARTAGFEYVAIYFDELDADGDGYLDESEWDLGQRNMNVSFDDDSNDIPFEQAGFDEVEDEEDEALMDQGVEN